KGLADTALRTADAGYLTRRLVDVSQDVIIKTRDCGTTDGILAVRLVSEGKIIETIGDRAYSRISAKDVSDPDTGEALIAFGDLLTKVQCGLLDAIDERYVRDVEAAGGDEDAIAKAQEKYIAAGFETDEHGRMGMKVRSPITCELEIGICANCYGIDLASHKIVEDGVAVGIIAAQSIG
ncbi:MAG: hypothetical protein JSS65_12265, partial [Armatimonadetes bacterium]|nr:hypothetical protein [Armatimonadota bacterium]